MIPLRPRHITVFACLAGIRLLWIVTPCTLNAQRVYHVDIENGLCTNALTDLTCDRQGNMWIGSYSGLMKYSGTGITCFEKIGNTPDAISGPEMHSIAEDACGFIWVGTTAGLDKINPVTYEVEHFPIVSPFAGSSSVGYIYAVYADRYDFIWVSTDVALFKFDSHTGNYYPIPLSKDGQGIISQLISYNGFFEMDNGIWISTAAGVAFYDYTSEQFFHRYNNPGRLSIFSVFDKPYTDQSGIELDSAGRLWFVRDHKHLAWYDVKSDIMDSIPLPVPPGTWPCCYSVAIDPHQKIWVGTRHGGVFIYDPEHRAFQSLRAQGPNRLIQSDYVYAIERGAGGKMFVAHDQGLDIIDLYDVSIREYKINDHPDFINMKYATGDLTYDAIRDVIYIPYPGYGVVEFDHNTSYFKEHRITGSELGNVGYVFLDNGNPYAAGKGNLQRVEISSDTITPLPGMLFPDTVSRIRGEIIWCYKVSAAEYYFKKSNEILYHAKDNQLTALVGAGFKANAGISPDSAWLSYINSRYELVRIQLREGKADTVPLQQYLKHSTFSFANARHLVDDGQSVWVTGQNGVLRFDYQSDSLYTYGMDKGLSHAFTFALVTDGQTVWVGSIGGIDRYNAVTDRFESVHKIKDNTYMDAFGDATRSTDGRLFFIFGNKLIVIHPDELSGQPMDHKPLLLQSVRVNGKSIDWTQEGVLNTLSFTQNQLTFVYDLQWFEDPGLMRFHYRLNGEAWVENGNDNSIQLAGLQPGTYLLEVQALEDDLVIAPLQIPFQINPPVWLTWWFRLLIGGIILAGTVIVFQRRIKRIKEKTTLEMQMVHLKSPALRAQMNPHFVFNSLNAIQECVVTGKVDEAYTYLSKFSRLLRLVLEHSDKHAVLLQDELEVLSLYLTLEELRFKEDMQFEIKVAPEMDPEEIFVPPMLIQPHLENAIWHGLRYVEGVKRLSIDVSEYQKRYVRIVVEDNGVGREKAAALKHQRLAAKPHRSMGSKLSSEQLALLHHQYEETRVTIVDMADEDGKPCGTRVELILPMLEKTNTTV
jgi:ligand-binding sensor domain-containing protein